MLFRGAPRRHKNPNGGGSDGVDVGERRREGGRRGPLEVEEGAASQGTQPPERQEGDSALDPSESLVALPAP